MYMLSYTAHYTQTRKLFHRALNTHKCKAFALQPSRSANFDQITIFLVCRATNRSNHCSVCPSHFFLRPPLFSQARLRLPYTYNYTFLAFRLLPLAASAPRGTAASHHALLPAFIRSSLVR
jgi:hypothetical protein